MSKIRYFTQYSGPGYSSFDQEYMEAETSLYGAMVAFRRKNVMGYDDVTTFRENPEGLYVPWCSNRRVNYDGTTSEDYADLLYAVPDEHGAYILGDWAYRLTIGPRKGVRVEKC